MKKKNSSVTVFAPASSANLGSGFDVFGLSVDGPGDFLRLEENSKGVLRIATVTGDRGRLSKVAEENTAGVALSAYLNALGIRKGFDIHLKKKLPLGSGLGSSAASAVAAVFAANELLGRPMTKLEMIRWAAEGERVASGSVHADNIAPSMLGGITLVRTLEANDILSLPVPSRMRLVVVHPHVEVKTSDARKVLPRQIPLKTGISQWANTASLAVACFRNDLDLFGRAMTDHVAEPARRVLIPCYDEVKRTVMAAGAVGCCISGAGPSILSVFATTADAHTGAAAMKSIYRTAGIGCDVFITRVDRKGARVIR